MTSCQLQKHELPSVEPLMLATAARPAHSSIMAAITRMTRDLEQERASKMALESVDLADAGQLEVRIPLVSSLGSGPDPADSVVRKHPADFAKLPL
jgi:hypothetical protein